MTSIHFLAVEDLRQYRGSPPPRGSVSHLVHESASPNKGIEPTGISVSFIRQLGGLFSYTSEAHPQRWASFFDGSNELRMGHYDLPERWLERLMAHLREKHGGERSGLSAKDFSSKQTLKIIFQDGSFAFFRYAFYLLDRDLKEVAVFTEHCGYHIYPLYGTRLEVLESKWTDDEYE